MSARRSARPGEYPNLLPLDIVSDGVLTLYRNPAGKVFGEKDAFAINVSWLLPADMSEAFNQAVDEEAKLATQHTFAWDPDFGYLSPNPGHCGTGLVIQAEFHLEGLHLIGDLPPVLAGLDAVRVRADGIDADGIRQAAHMFRLHNNSAIGLSEHALVKRIRQVYDDVIEQEISARKALVTDHPRLFEDAIARSLALLRNARLLSPWEFFDLLSPLKMAATMGFIKGITRREIDTLMRRQLEKPPTKPPETEEEERLRDERDADIADRANQRFADVDLNDRAQDILS